MLLDARLVIARSLCLAVFLVTLLLSPTQTTAVPSADRVVSEDYINLKIAADVPEAAVRAMASRHGPRVVRRRFSPSSAAKGIAKYVLVVDRHAVGFEADRKAVDVAHAMTDFEDAVVEVEAQVYVRVLEATPDDPLRS